MRATAWVTNLVIAAAATESNALTAGELADAETLTIFAPGTLPEAVRIQVSNTNSPAAADWRDLDEGGGDIVIGAGQARSVDLVAFKAIRLLAAAGVAAERVFNVNKSFSTR